MQYLRSKKEEPLIAKLKRLLACDSIRLHSQQGGGNSTVFCIEAKGKKWAVKSYPPYAPDQRDRLTSELMVYQFLNEHNINAVPNVKTHCPEERWLMMSWIEGAIPNDYSSDDINQAVQFITNIAALNSLEKAKQLPLAAEACLCLQDLFDQIQRRLARLEVFQDEFELHDFLNHDFRPTFEIFKRQALHACREPTKPLPMNLRSLIPADFGFHNALRDPTGKLFFFDFDYFGWDDPTKLLADILWHPKMNLTQNQKQQFIDGLSNIYQNDPNFLNRFYYTFPLFGLRWTLILLNEFIPAFWQNRQHARTHQTQAEAKSNQLKKAKELLKQIRCIV